MAEFLLEIGLEEIPARMIAGAEAELGKQVAGLLARERLTGEDAAVKTFSTPRRLAVLISGVRAAQADLQEQLTGPSWNVAFKDGVATKAAEAFAKKAGVELAALEKITTAKGEYIGATVRRQGKAAGEILSAELPKECWRSTGQRTCTGARASRSGLCGRCGGWWPSWIRRWCRWRSLELRRGI